MTADRARDFATLDTLAVRALTTAEQFVLGVCRCWDAFVADPDPALPWRQLAPVFAYMNVMGAFCAFERTFQILSAGRSAALEFREADCALIGADEARVLSCLASLQRGNAREAITTLTASLTRYGVHAIMPPLARIAAVLDVKGHRLPLWRGFTTDAAPGIRQMQPSVRKDENAAWRQPRMQ